MRSLKTVLTFLSFCTKRFYTHKKAPKAQKGNQTKAQNANKRTKITNALKKHLGGGGGGVTYSLICVFVLANKSIYNRNIDLTELVKVLSALYKQKLVH